MRILTDLAPAALTSAIEENLFSLFRAIGGLPGGRLEETEQMLWYTTGLPAPVFNGVARTRTRGAPLSSSWFSGVLRISRFLGGG